MDEVDNVKPFCHYYQLYRFWKLSVFGRLDKWMHSHLFDWKSMGTKLCLPSFCMELIFCVLTLFYYSKGIADQESRSTPFFLPQSLETRLKEKGRKINKLRKGQQKGTVQSAKHFHL